MIPVLSFAGRKVALFGLGGSGLATALALRAGGAEVVAFDDSEKAVAEAGAAGVPTGDLRRIDWSKVSALVLAPGVPLTHPVPHWSVTLARNAAVEVIGDVELFCRERARTSPEAPFIAITGTNGKSTTTALIAHLLASAGRDVQLGGNIGTPILSLAPPGTGRFHVIECSSFQIDLAPSLNPSVGLMLNLSEDHIDRHGTFANYAAIKERLVAASGTAIVGVDDGHSRAMADRLAQAGRRVKRISTRNPVAEGFYAVGSAIWQAENGANREIVSLGGIGSLRGQHNAENAAAAIAAAREVGLAEAAIRYGIRSFPGLPHRMEQVGCMGHVLFVNDSKATNADATARALASFERIYWILGGKPKAGGITSLDAYFPKIAKAYLIGQAAEEFARTLAGKVPFVMAGDLETATRAAAADAAEDHAREPVVLLSPACASYDQFRNFEQRGDSFRSLVRSLDGVRANGRAA